MCQRRMWTLDCSVGNGGRHCSDGAGGVDGFGGVDDGVNGVDGGGFDGVEWWPGGFDGVDGWRRWLRWLASVVVTGVSDTEGTDVEVPPCPQ